MLLRKCPKQDSLFGKENLDTWEAVNETLEEKKISDDGKYLEMTQAEWDATHQDFKSEPGEPKRALALHPKTGGSVSFPVKIVSDPMEDNVSEADLDRIRQLSGQK